MRTLYLFPILFPYTRFGECFLEEELKYTSKCFDKVVIIPLRKEVPERKPLPNNCTVEPPLMESKKSIFLKALFNWAVYCKMIPEFFREKVFLDKAKFSVWLRGFAESNIIMNSEPVRRIGKELQSNDVCYFYWGKWSNIIAAYWKGRCHFVSRFHGTGDLWEDIYHEYFPLRKQVLESLDKAVFISQSGEKYFQKKYPGCKTMYSPLGSVSVGVPTKLNDGVIRVVSCSTIIPLKRVDLIFKSLNMLRDMKIEWTHIGGAVVGDDTLFKELLANIKSSNNRNLTVNLVGSLPHDEVMEYYSHHSYDAFINLSISEGVPVSIMEAISCDIPIVATDVGGTCEVVTPETGVLVSANPTEYEVAEAVKRCVLNNKYTPRLYWESHFNAQVNYERFAICLANLSKGVL